MHANELIDDDHQNLYMIGYCYKMINDNENAMLYFNKSSRYYHAVKDEINPFPEIAEIYYHSRKYKETLEAIDLALKYEPDINYLLLLKSFAYGHLGDNTKSEAFYQEALTKSQDDIYPLYRAHYYIEIEKYQDASVLLNQAVQKDIRKNECFAELGYIALINGDDKQAKKILTEASKMDISDELVLQYLTYYYYLQKDKTKTEFFYGLYMMIADDLDKITVKDVFHDVESRFRDDQTFINLLKSRN